MFKIMNISQKNVKKLTQIITANINIALCLVDMKIRLMTDTNSYLVLHC